jgi:hypothetical protein
MKAKHVFGGGLALAALIALAPPSMTTVAAQEGKGLPLRLRAFAVDLNTNTARPNPGSNRTTNTVDIVIERWSTPEEVEKLRGALMEEPDRRGRSTVLLPALQAIRPRCGFARTSTSLGWDIHYARQIPIEGGGRRIVVATDRPIEMWEARNNTRSRDHEFSLAEIHLGPDGTGQGTAITMAALRFNAETKTLEIENYQIQPVRLNNITTQ